MMNMSNSGNDRTKSLKVGTMGGVQHEYTDYRKFFMPGGITVEDNSQENRGPEK